MRVRVYNRHNPHVLSDIIRAAACTVAEGMHVLRFWVMTSLHLIRALFY